MEIQTSIFLGILLTGFIYIGIADYLKVTQQKPTLLKVSFRPILSIGLAIFLSSFIIPFPYIAFTFTPIRQITCEHDKYNVTNANFNARKIEPTLTNCKIADIDWFNEEKNIKLISNLTEAKLDKKIKTEDEKLLEDRYRIILLSQNEIIPFTDYEYDYKYIHSKVNDFRLLISSINDFLINSQEDKLNKIIDDTNDFYIGSIGIAFIAIIGLLLVSIGLFINSTFDKETNLLTVTRYRWFGIFGKKVSEYPLNEIVNVKTDGYQVTVILPNKELLLTPVFAFKKTTTILFFSTTMSNQSKTVIDIKNFLGLKIMD